MSTDVDCKLILFADNSTCTFLIVQSYPNVHCVYIFISIKKSKTLAILMLRNTVQG